MLMRNLNLNTEESCGIYKRLSASEEWNLRPGNAFRIGTLEFVVERFNTAVVTEIGQRPHMEDTYKIIQDLMISTEVPVTYYAVFDGHGGQSCSLFLKTHLHNYLVAALTDKLDGILESDDMNSSLVECINKAFHECD